MSINRLQLLFWLIVLDADVWKQTRRWKLKLFFWDDGCFQLDRGSIGCMCMSVQRTPPPYQCQTPPVGSLRPLYKRAGGERGEGREVRGSRGVFTLWLLQRGCRCQRVAMATLFDSYNNARAPLPLAILHHLWATHTDTDTHKHTVTHKVWMIGRLRRVSRQSGRSHGGLRRGWLTMPMRIKRYSCVIKILSLN